LRSSLFAIRSRQNQCDYNYDNNRRRYANSNVQPSPGRNARARKYRRACIRVPFPKSPKQRSFKAYWSFDRLSRQREPLQPARKRALISKPHPASRTRAGVRERLLAQCDVHHLTMGEVARDVFYLVTTHAKHLAGFTSSGVDL
jgi:hypothetical protein